VRCRLPLQPMDHHPKFEHSRFIGDKRTQLVYDLDTWDEPDIINEIVDEGVGLSFGPDTLAEARNRGYTLANAGHAPALPQAAGPDGAGRSGVTCRG
jgi:hypothetical protein